jgi:hypothetical protein
MNSFIGFAGVGGAIIASMGLAMWLEWFCLRWLMRIMPGRLAAPQSTLAAADAGEEHESLAPEPQRAEPEMPVASPAEATRHEIRLGI